MKKIGALIVNELHKIFLQSSVWVMLSVLILICIVPPVYVFVSSPEIFDPKWSDELPLEYEKPRLQNQLRDVNSKLASPDLPENFDLSRSQLLDMKSGLEASVERFDFLITSGYTSVEPIDFIADASSYMISFRLAIRVLEEIPENRRTPEEANFLLFLRESLDLIRSLPETRNFRSYIDMCGEYLERGKKVGFSDHVIASVRSDLSVLEEIYSMDPSGGIDGSRDYRSTKEAIQYINASVESLRRGYAIEAGFEGQADIVRVLTPDEYTRSKDSVIIAEKRLFENSYPSDFRIEVVEQIRNISNTGGNFVIAILLLVTAGSSISQEFATGSVKSLVIAPIRRWKILTAKFLVLLSLWIISLLVLSVFSNLAGMIVFGSDKYVDYVYVLGGTAKTIPYWIYDFLCVILENVDLFVFSVFALMLSTITRNTAVSVVISTALFLAKDSFVSWLTYYFQTPRNWTDFIPFVNFSFKSDVFPFEIYRMPTIFQRNIVDGNSFRPGPLFSSIYLFVLVFIMFMISLESFSRRDIK